VELIRLKERDKLKPRSKRIGDPLGRTVLTVRELWGNTPGKGGETDVGILSKREKSWTFFKSPMLFWGIDIGGEDGRGSMSEEANRLRHGTLNTVRE